LVRLAAAGTAPLVRGCWHLAYLDAGLLKSYHRYRHRDFQHHLKQIIGRQGCSHGKRRYFQPTARNLLRKKMKSVLQGQTHDGNEVSITCQRGYPKIIRLAASLPGKRSRIGAFLLWPVKLFEKRTRRTRPGAGRKKAGKNPPPGFCNVPTGRTTMLTARPPR
jgi:hypothetical protein